jgi:transcriptional regulator with XRE-family HTH domain
MEATGSTTAKVEGAATVGDFIRQRRIALGMKQSDLCRKLGKYQVWASQKENGYSPVKSEDVPALAQALQVDAAELRAMVKGEGTVAAPAESQEPMPTGVVTKEVVTTEVLRWQAGVRSVRLEELSREDLLAAARSLFEENARLRGEFEKEMGEIAEAYEE